MLRAAVKYQAPTMTKRSTTASSNFTARRLLGVPSPDVIQFVEFLDRSRCEREREHDAEARCALAGYVVARMVASRIELESSGDWDAFTWQSEAVHRHVNDLPQDRAEVAHLQGILRTLNGPPDLTCLRTALEAFSYFLDHERRAPEALAILPLVARIHGDPLSPATFTGLAFRAGSLYRQSGAWDRSHSAYTAAEERPPDATATSHGAGERSWVRPGHCTVGRKPRVPRRSWNVCWRPRPAPNSRISVATPTP